MLHDVAPGLLVGSLALGALHGAEPGHGWPIAAAYAFDRANAWLAGLAAGLIIGIGHLISSLAVVGVFFLVKTQVPLDGLSEPMTVAGVAIGSPIGVVAGVLLILLGIREYRGGGHGHSHGTEHGHSHADDHGHAADHDHRHHGEDDGHAAVDHAAVDDGPGRLHAAVDLASTGRGVGHDHAAGDDNGGGVLARLRTALPIVGDGGAGGDRTHDADHGDGDGHAHDHDLSADDGLYGIAVSAFVLGFAHEEEFEIIAICAGSDHCLELMLAYAGTVVVVITALTLALVAGYERFEDRMERYAEHFPTVSAIVLVTLGLGFLLGVL
ncbi:hypothetical protein [Halobaculum magnesiiphilum]|uniref:Nickel/cobalt efflux system n=1 Tax=Halobaculum magnesiiphilum TaxID=1017351 RepID=A0A8T8WG25_9EURY|nr:hypothetical protein [Halobaculum magnesiiphilum]QZP38694.1 hypothetical protein K6T50_06030 [Halobaculum magnesiiphilum]